MDEETTVSVPVPTWLLPEVYELLGRRMSEGRTRHLSEPMHAPRVSEASRPYLGQEHGEMLGQRRFTGAELGLLKRALDPRSLPRTMLDMCAELPGEPISFDQVVARAGLESAQAKGQLGAFTKILKKLFRNPQWPVVVHFGSQGQATYIMPEGMARIWREI